MKTKYNKPAIEVVTLELATDLMINTSTEEVDMDEVGIYKGGSAGAKRRNIWED